MNPNKLTINIFCDNIFEKIKQNLDNLFKEQKFKVYEKQTIYIINSKYIYQDINDIYNIIFEEDNIDTEKEYIVFDINKIINRKEFNELYSKKNNLYNLHITLIYQDLEGCIRFLYEPDKAYILNKINIELFEEYLQVYYLFNKIRIFNHTHNYNENEKKISFSLNGMIYNRPDREYFIVMNDNYNFNIQVYKLLPNNKRDIMLFGIWMNISSCGKKVISEPFIFN